jgi:ATP synthase protein I
MSDSDDRNRELEAFTAKVKAVQDRRTKSATRSAAAAGASTGQMGLGFRISVELLATLGVGTGMGYVLDRWLQTGPWLMLTFFMLGAAAGMRNVIRTATAALKKADETAPEPPPDRPA